MALVGDGVLAVTEGVPELDGAVARAGDDLAVVGGEGDRQNVVGVADEAAGGGTSGELPEAEGLVPRRGESVGTVRGDNLWSVSARLRLPDYQLLHCCHCRHYCRQLLPCAGVRTQSDTMWEWPWRLLFG